MNDEQKAAAVKEYIGYLTRRDGDIREILDLTFYADRLAEGEGLSHFTIPPTPSAELPTWQKRLAAVERMAELAGKPREFADWIAELQTMIAELRTMIAEGRVPAENPDDLAWRKQMMALPRVK